MILIDANLLLYAYDASSEFHAPARDWLETMLSGPTAVRLSWSCIHAFLRLTTHPAVFVRPLPMKEAVAIVDSWFEQPTVAVLEPGQAYWDIFRELLRRAQVRGPLVMDAHLAALAIEHGAVLYTVDRDFLRFDGVQVVNPLE
jgi:toxin-antitoxin system PIN domain toxin